MKTVLSDRASFGEILAALFALAAAGAAGPLLFAIAEAGYSSLEHLIFWVKIPALLVLVLIYLIARSERWKWLSGALVTGLWVGALSTVGMEVIRITGFRVFHAMPGDLPTLLGVLMTGRIMVGPDTWSTLLGYANHFWNGATFGILFTLLLGKPRAWWAGPFFGVVVGTGFMLSPVPNALGVGVFAVQMDPQFAITVYLAHLVYGAGLGWLVQRSAWIGRSGFHRFFQSGDRVPLAP